MVDMSFETISSLQNPRVKNAVRLREGNHRRRQRKFLIEGYRELSRAFEKEVICEELYFCPEFFRNPNDIKLVEEASARGTLCFRVTPQVFEKAAYREGPDGFLAVAPMWTTELHDLKLSPTPLLLVIESVEKPGNLGTLIRTADAAGVEAVIVTDPVTDVFNPNCIRSSQGAFFAQTIAVCTNDDLIKWLSGKGIRLYATTPRAQKNLWEVDYTGPCAILMGSEKEGLSDLWLEMVPDVETINIPMAGQSDSLNVSACAAVFLFEAVRQRKL